MDIALVLDRIRHNAKWRMSGTYELLQMTWEDETPIPTLAELEAEWNVYLQEQANTQYIRNRQAEYASVTDQLDGIFHAFVDLITDLKKKNVLGPEATAWIDQIQAIKDKYPKPV